MKPRSRQIDPLGAFGCPADAVAVSVDSRADRLGAHDAAVWRRTRELLAARPPEPSAGAAGVAAAGAAAGPGAALDAVVANLFGVVVYDDPEDHALAARLAQALGSKRLARLHLRAAELLAEADPGRSWSTEACRRWIGAAAVARAEPTEPTAADLAAAACEGLGYAMLLTDLESAPPTTPLRTVVGFLTVAEHGTLAEWRSHLGMVAARPWGTYSRDLLRLARRCRSDLLRDGVERAVALCREEHQARERADVAREIRRSLALSGVSQREFAAEIGTSASRLSTYATGAVVPSATMLLRIRRTARLLEQRQGGPGQEPPGSTPHGMHRR
ncbi:helix-turn-helix transcriptional regulator [Nocardioides albidus]|uniref:Helix-turn-helix transcriptional regulator n=1 Tax=Nocardioides albidus TaxID=1517589 RepID=A0A5C4VR45_9ACTN|nr:helix-turn-helix transcriptional regulator [Nocardioides albidus]TNM38318.1 helix-turn-helix transcriptional regulator [Nocardioides albidus]